MAYKTLLDLVLACPTLVSEPYFRHPGLLSFQRKCQATSNLGPLHMRFLLPGILFPIFTCLLLIPSGLNLNITSSKRTSLSTLPNLVSTLINSLYFSLIAFIKTAIMGNSLAVQWLGSWASTAEGLGLIPGQGTEIPQTTRCGQKKKTPKQTKKNPAIIRLYLISLNSVSFTKFHEVS